MAPPGTTWSKSRSFKSKRIVPCILLKPPAGGSGWKSTAGGGWIPPEKVSDFKAQFNDSWETRFFQAFLDEKSGCSPVMVGNLRIACNRSEDFHPKHFRREFYCNWCNLNELLDRSMLFHLFFWWVKTLGLEATRKRGPGGSNLHPFGKGGACRGLSVAQPMLDHFIRRIRFKSGLQIFFSSFCSSMLPIILNNSW